MDISVETDKLRHILEVGLIDKTFSDTLFRITRKGIMINDFVTIKGLGIVSLFKPNYFSEYPNKDNTENVVITETIGDIFKKRAFKGKSTRVHTDDENIYLQSGSERYDEPLTFLSDDTESTDQQRLKNVAAIKSTDYGILLKNNFDPVYVAKVRTQELTLPESESCLFHVENREMNVQVKLVGNYSRDIQVEEVKMPASEEYSFKFNGNILSSMLKQFVGEVWVVIEEHGFIALTQRSSEHFLLYVLGETD